MSIIKEVQVQSLHVAVKYSCYPYQFDLNINTCELSHINEST